MAKKTLDPKSTVYAEINTLVDKYNESAEFSEFKEMKAIDAKIAEKVQEYNALCETECFIFLKSKDNPMLEAAKMMRYPTIKIKDQKEENGGTTRVIETSSKMIDPLRLEKTTKDGIGNDKMWAHKIEHLNFLMTVRRAIELNIDPATLGDYSISAAAKHMPGFKTCTDPNKFDLKQANADLLEDIQLVVNAMIGEGFTVSNTMVNYLLSIYTRKDSRTSLSVTVANHKNMRQYMLEICHAAITGDVFVLNYKKAKN